MNYAILTFILSSIISSAMAQAIDSSTASSLGSALASTDVDMPYKQEAAAVEQDAIDVLHGLPASEAFDSLKTLLESKTDGILSDVDAAILILELSALEVLD